jgi:alkylated DNA nucleotide flippase Atl1
MATVSDDEIEAVRALVAAIPEGQVTTYGDLAAVGLSSPRIVGWIMRTDSADLPWHRVVPANGRPAAHLETRQLDRLREEGVPITDGRIHMSDCRWLPAIDAPRSVTDVKGFFGSEEAT